VIHEAIRGSRFVVVEGAGHTVHVERPEEFAASVAEHVAWAAGRTVAGERS
jgi:pimeloyl-ACP methyl ester carboxylesterase